MLWESQSDCVSDLYTITGAERCGSAPYYQEELEMTQELQKGRKQMICSVCHTETNNIDPMTNTEIFPVCVPCLDSKVEEMAQRKTQPTMVKSSTHRASDDTPQQLTPDTRYKYR